MVAAQNLALTASAQSITVQSAGAPATAVSSAVSSTRDQSGAAMPVASAEQSSSAAVNINVASANELASLLNGVGARKAEAIVRYREQFGPFESVDELSEVAGIGASTVERNRAVIRLQ
jgi:competence protein ComEA